MSGDFDYNLNEPRLCIQLFTEGNVDPASLEGTPDTVRGNLAFTIRDDDAGARRFACAARVPAAAKVRSLSVRLSGI
jgi:hypothetical protein